MKRASTLAQGAKDEKKRSKTAKKRREGGREEDGGGTDSDARKRKPAKRVKPLRRPEPAPLRFPSALGVTFDKSQLRWTPRQSALMSGLELPPEVWALVFERLQDDTAALVTASHVSRVWRSLALGEVRRWTFASSTSSRKAPSRFEQQLRFLRELCPRVEALDVRDDDALDLADLHRTLDGLPRVHTLRLVVSPITVVKLPGVVDEDDEPDDDEEREGMTEEQKSRLRTIRQRRMPASIRSLELTFSNLAPSAHLERLWWRLSPQLRTLKLNGLRSSPQMLFHRVRKLTKLHMESCFTVDDTVLSALPRSLTSLSLQGARVTDVGVSALATTLPNLRKLDLSRCVSVTQESIAHLPQGLETLSVAFCQHIKDDALRRLPPGLRKLNCWGCGNISNAGVRALPSGLEELILSFCKVDDQGIALLPRGLKRLVIQYCFSVTLKGLEENLPPSVQSVNMGTLDSMTAATSSLSAHSRLSRLLVNRPLSFLPCSPFTPHAT